MVTTPNYDLDIDTTLGGANASDYVIPSQKAIKSYVDNSTGGTAPEWGITKTYTEECPALTPTEGICTWILDIPASNLPGPEPVIFSIKVYNTSTQQEVIIQSTYDGVISINSNDTIPAGSYVACVTYQNLIESWM